jgi:hypothetical protein
MSQKFVENRRRNQEGDVRRLYSFDRFREEERTSHNKDMGTVPRNNKVPFCIAALLLQQFTRLRDIDCALKRSLRYILLGDSFALCQFAAQQWQFSCRSAPLSPRFGRRAL